MVVTRLPNAMLVALFVCVLSNAAVAQSASASVPPVPHPHAVHAKLSHTVPRPLAASTSQSQTMSNLLKGSASQQDLERRDNDLAGFRPIDHSHDDLGSDLRGVQ